MRRFESCRGRQLVSGKAVTGPDQTVIVFCDEGYASSLAAASLQAVGLPRATDLDGGYQAWRAAGLPTTSFSER